MRHPFHVLALAAVAALAAESAQAARPVARIVEVKGKVTIAAAEGRTRPAVPFDTIYLDDQITLASGGQIVLAFRGDGHLERVQRAGQVKAGPDGCLPPGAAEPVALPEPQKIVVSGAVQQLQPIYRGGATTVRSPRRPGEPPRETPPPIVRQPAAGSVVLSPRPVFSWSPVPKAASCQVNLYECDKKIWSVETTKTTAAYDGPSPLKGGSIYVWELVAVLDAETSQSVLSGEFMIATDAQRAQAAQLKAFLGSNDVPLLTLAAIWYTEQKMVPEAMAANEKLLKLDPKCGSYYAALATLYEMAGREEQSAAARRKARDLLPPPPPPPRPEWLKKLPSPPRSPGG